MRQGGDFTFMARRYARSHHAHRLASTLIRWAPAGFLLAAAFRYLSESQSLFPLWWCFPAMLIPPIIGFIVASFEARGVLRALSWLDSKVSGNQELQAAWEIRKSDSILKELVLSSGARLLTDPENKRSVPGPGTSAVMLSLVAAVIFLLTVIVGESLFAPPGQEFKARGSELEEWARSWADAADGIGRPESRDLAGRMEELGRRMADGTIGERQAERALRAVEEEVEERRTALVRDKLAEALAEDLGLNRESAESFRVQHRRLPSDVLAELGQAVEGSSSISEMDKEAIEKLLSDPEFRDRLNYGTPELTEELTQALQDALDPVDTRISELDEAESESRKARGEGDGPGGRGKGKAGEGDSDESSGGRTGGGGRGSSEVEDEPGESKRLPRTTADEPLHLPMDSERTGSWKTVIRAYSEENGFDPTAEGGLSAEWKQEVESVIHREDIPPGTRDYVRAYFTALEEGPEDNNEEE